MNLPHPTPVRKCRLVIIFFHYFLLALFLYFFHTACTFVEHDFSSWLAFIDVYIFFFNTKQALQSANLNFRASTNSVSPRRSIRGNSSTTSFKILTNERAQQIRLGAMLFVVTVVFAWSYTPSLIAQYTHIIPDTNGWNKFVFFVYFINNAANPIIYGVMNKQFRSEMAKFYLPCIALSQSAAATASSG